MNNLFMNILKEDAHRVYNPLEEELSKYKNFIFLTISKFQGFNSSKFHNKIINRFIQIFVYLRFTKNFIQILFLKRNKKIVVREFSTYYLFFLLPFVYLGRKRFVYVINHNIQIAYNKKGFQKFMLYLLFKADVRFIFFESSQGKEHFVRKLNSSQEIVSPFFIPKIKALKVAKSDAFICEINNLKDQNYIIISIPGRPSKEKGSYKLINLIDKFLKNNSDKKYKFIVSNKLLNIVKSTKINASKFICPPEDSYKYYDAFISLSNCAIFNYDSRYYYYRHSGVILDCLSRRTAVICPDYPLLKNMVNYPVSVGLTFNNLENLNFILENKISHNWIETLEWEIYFRERSISKVVGSLLSKI